MIAEEKYYRIGEVAKLYNLTTPTIWFYEEIGLFLNLKRSAGGLRMFSAEELACIEDVECLKKTGMPLKDIADYIKWKQAGDSSLLQRLELIKKQKQSLEQNIFDLQRELEKLKYKECTIKRWLRPGRKLSLVAIMIASITGPTPMK